MKKYIATTAAVAVLCVVSIFQPAFGQQTAEPALPHKVGVIDMAYLFKNYKKFETLREDLKVEIQKSDQDAKRKAEQIKGLQEQMKQFKEGTPEYLDFEKRLAGSVAEFETFRKVAQRDFLRKESQVYKQVYLEVLDAVKAYAQHYKYTLIVRFNREDLASVDNPQQVLERMNQQVVFFRPSDDVTERVLRYLNSQYEKTASRTSGAAGGARRQ